MPSVQQRKQLRHTLTLSPYFDRWVSARMAERGQSRRTVIEAIISATIDGRGVHLSPDRAGEIIGHANAQRLIVSEMRLTTRSPDQLRCLAEIDAAATAIGRLLNARR